MRAGALAPVLLTLGLLVGVVAAGALAVGADPARLAPALVTIGLYKLAFIGAGALLVGGAVLGRRARRRGGPTASSGRSA